MCGINGVYGEYSQKLLKDMNKRIKHRGPDSQGFHFDKEVGLGNVRLSIIDVVGGDQPIYNDDKTIVIVYNGELYNFKELRSALKKKGHKFKTNCDTEVILRSYEEKGIECLDDFNGMFAFAIWDSRVKQLFVARDRLGIKPLYYHYSKGRLVFSSEIKGILVDDAIKAEANEKAIMDYLAFQMSLGDKTFFKGIKKLLPGHYILMGKAGKGKVQVKRYWEPEFTPGNDSPKQTLKDFRKTLKASVKRHLISDVPVGTYLSGGFDSSSVALNAKKFNSNINSFTGYFKEAEKYSELPQAEAVAKKHKLKPKKVLINSDLYKKNIRKIIYHLDEPSIGTGYVPQYFVAGEARKKVKVMLTGHGGDELFAGYEVFKAATVMDKIKKNPVHFFDLFFKSKPSEIVRLLYFTLYPIVQPEVKYGLAVPFSKNDRDSVFTESFKKKIGGYEPGSEMKKLLDGKDFTAPEAVQYVYMLTYLPALLTLEDKISMAHSLEARTPICDNEMIDLSLTTPVSTKLFENNLKYVVKEAMRRDLPASLYDQPKKGFPTPFSLWFRNELKEFIEEILLDEKTLSRGVFNPEYVEKLLKHHYLSKTDNLYDYVRAFKIFALVAVELWYRIYIDGEGVNEN